VRPALVRAARVDQVLQVLLWPNGGPSGYGKEGKKWLAGFQMTI
jgi:hypothetical protein